MGQQHRLGVLQVGPAGHRDAEVPLGLVGQRVGQPADQPDELARLLAQVHPDQGGDLVVAGPPGPQPAAELGAGPLEQAALQRGVHVLVVAAGRERTGYHVGVELIQPGQHRRPARRRSAGRPGAAPGRAPREPAMSCRASRQSKWVDSDSAASASAGPPANRPPHSGQRLVCRCSRVGRSWVPRCNGSSAGAVNCIGQGPTGASQSGGSRLGSSRPGPPPPGSRAMTRMVSSPAMVPRTSGRPARSSALARNWTRPAGSAARPGSALASAETSSSASSRASRGGGASVGSPGGQRRAVLGHHVDRLATVRSAQLDRAELVQVPAQGGLGDRMPAAASRSSQFPLRAKRHARPAG